MSTRCSIIVKNEITGGENYMYHHCDGYLSGVGSDLCELLKKYIDKNGYDNVSNESITKFINDSNDSFEFADSIPGDIEYVYEIVITKDCFIKLHAFAADNWGNKLKYEEDLTENLFNEVVMDTNSPLNPNVKNGELKSKDDVIKLIDEHLSNFDRSFVDVILNLVKSYSDIKNTNIS